MRHPEGGKYIPVQTLIQLLQQAAETYTEDGKQLCVSVNMVQNLGLSLDDGRYLAYIDIREEALTDLRDWDKPREPQPARV